MSEPDFAQGEATGIPVPAHADALRGAGADWLTRAFRAYGALPADNAVSRITRSEAFERGNSGDKLLLSVDFAHPDPALHTELFVKFSCCQGDPFRDRRRHELVPEVRIAALSRHPEFPVAVAKPYFADIDSESGVGVLITQRIGYGEGHIEPALAKNMDHLLADPAEYYRATVSALARLAAAHQSGRLSPEAERLFPFDREKSAAELPLPWNAAEVRARAERTAAFFRQFPQFFAPEVSTPDFAERFVADAQLFHRHDAAVRRFLYGDHRLVALAHWNTHIDNAWFWRDSSGTLQAGLLDWGMARQMNLGLALWGGLCGGNAALWENEVEGLIDHFLGELAAHGGHAIDPALFRLHFELAIGALSLALMLDTTAMFLERMPDLAGAQGPDDALLHRDKVVHGFMHTFADAMNHWQRRDFGASLKRMLETGSEAR